MDNCKHVKKLSMARNHSILNPQKWLCSVCGTTESVWACLSCANVACGRYNEEHALQHFKETQHCLAIEVNEKYVFCYECDDYVLNDNNAGELRIMRGCLRAVATQSLDELRQLKHSRLLRSQSARNLIDVQKGETLKDEDRAYTILRFRRHYLLQRIFTVWKTEVANIKADKKEPAKVKVEANATRVADLPSSSKAINDEPVASTSQSEAKPATLARKKGPFVPGVIGLRNLGNTCYMNSILQVLSQVSECRDFVLYHLSSLPFTEDNDSSPSRPSWAGTGAHVKYSKQTSVDFYTHVVSGLKKATAGCPGEGNGARGGGKKCGRGRPPGGLNGGSSASSDDQQPTTSSGREPISVDSDSWSLGHELYALFRVMWSGKWALVSPHKILAAVWKAIPYFRGYTQHDAQEFLCEFLDKLQSQLNDHQLPALPSHLNLPRSMRDIFEGSLVSEVKCLTCGTTTVREEPFMDLSLEFPSRYQVPTGSSMFADSHPCSIEEMLFNFTAMEKLEGRVYACEACNSTRRRASRHQVLCEAEKRLRIKTLPHTLRLHLKRFMWSGRNIRCKISSHVDFGQQLNMAPYCERQACDRDLAVYHLTAVVIHHGRGFGSGHYTSYCWNSDIGAWMHCNDAIVDITTLYDVLKAQAYILVYTRDNGSQHREVASTSGVNSHAPLTNMDNDDAKSVHCDDPTTNADVKISLGKRVTSVTADCTDDLATDAESLAGDRAESVTEVATTTKGNTRGVGRPRKALSKPRTGTKRVNSEEVDSSGRQKLPGRKRKRTSQ